MARHKNTDWNLSEQPSYDGAQLAVLMDIRDATHAVHDELKRLNQLLYCQNFINIPRTLKTIDKRLAKKVPLK